MFSNIVLFNETIVDTEILENVIIGDHECGLLIGEAKDTTVHDNWFGSLPDGTANPNFNDFCFNYTTNMTVGPGNQFSYSGGTAINYGDSSGVQITANNFFRNNFGAIDLWGPVGDEPEQPVIIAVSTATLTVVGKTSPEAIVEIYYSEKGKAMIMSLPARRTRQASSIAPFRKNFSGRMLVFVLWHVSRMGDLSFLRAILRPDTRLHLFDRDHRSIECFYRPPSDRDEYCDCRVTALLFQWAGRDLQPLD